MYQTEPRGDRSAEALNTRLAVLRRNRRKCAQERRFQQIVGLPEIRPQTDVGTSDVPSFPKNRDQLEQEAAARTEFQRTIGWRERIETERDFIRI